MTTVIKVFETTGEYAMYGATEGEAVYSLIVSSLSQDIDVTLDFEGVVGITSNFLNNAIGQLLRDYSPHDLNMHMKIINYPDGWARQVWNAVIDNAKDYYGWKA